MSYNTPAMARKKTPRPEPRSLGLPLWGVDSHAHLDMEPLVQDLNGVLARAREAGVAAVGQVFLGPEAYARNRALFEGRDETFFALGLHPHDASGCDADSLSAMEAACRGDARIKAFGEIGLDFFYDHSPREKQLAVFRDQLALARELNLPPVIHCRDAVDETLAILKDMGCEGRPLLWHCFGLGRDIAEAIVDRGWTISVPGTVSYPKSIALREAVPAIPLERLVLETDCPFLAPEPWRGKTNEPAMLAFTAAAVAELRGLPVEELWARTGETARAFFGV